MTLHLAGPNRACVIETTSHSPTSGPRAGPASRGSGERGFVLVWAAATTLIVGGVIMAATTQLKSMDEVTRAEFSAQGQATQVAEAGLVDAYAWFRRQQVQPVATFAPKRNLTANPPVNETDDVAQGLQRTFEISPGLWGRYTVRAGAGPETYVDANVNGHYDKGEVFTDTNGDAKWTQGHDTRSVTAERGLTGAGTVWQLVSHAQVFRRPRADLALGAGANTQIAESTLAAEVRRLTLSPPAAAAVSSSTAKKATIGNRGRLRSTGTCLAYGSTSGGSANIAAGELLGPTTVALVPSWNDSVDSVFGVDWTSLKSMADISTTDPVNGVPSPLPDMKLVVVTGNIVFDSTRPLIGTDILVVKGNVTISSGSNSFFNGLLYVDGDLTVRAPALLRGTVVCRGTVDVRGTGGDFVEIEYDAGILNKLMTVTGQYRYSKSPFQPSKTLSDGRPYEAWRLRPLPTGSVGLGG